MGGWQLLEAISGWVDGSYLSELWVGGWQILEASCGWVDGSYLKRSVEGWGGVPVT